MLSPSHPPPQTKKVKVIAQDPPQPVTQSKDVLLYSGAVLLTTVAVCTVLLTLSTLVLAPSVTSIQEQLTRIEDSIATKEQLNRIEDYMVYGSPEVQRQQNGGQTPWSEEPASTADLERLDKLLSGMELEDLRVLSRLLSGKEWAVESSSGIDGSSELLEGGGEVQPMTAQRLA